MLVLDDVLVGGQEHVELAAAQQRHQVSTHGGRALYGRQEGSVTQRIKRQGKARGWTIGEYYYGSGGKKDQMTDLVSDFDNGWCPLVELIHPVGESSGGNEWENISVHITDNNIKGFEMAICWKKRPLPKKAS